MKKKNKLEDIFNVPSETHRVWYKFSGWLQRTYGKDLFKNASFEIKDAAGKNKKIRYKNFNEYELSKRLVGYEVIVRIERYVKRFCPEIKIISCDDSVHAGSSILLIPHPGHGITILYIPQCTEIQNQFFLYESHCTQFLKELNKMKRVYAYDKKYKNRSKL